MSEDEAPGFFDETQPLALDDLPETMRLVVIGKDENLSVPLPSSGGLTVGRAETNDLQLDDASVSRQHLRLRVGADGAAPLTAEDLGSQNGIRMRGQRIPVGTPIPFGINEPLQVGAVVLVVTGRAPVDVSPSAPVVVDPQMPAIF
ncbi:MAG: FHA domain-containing protein [Myxococcota bacterium]